ncbi:MAG: 3-hydroxybutyryl-CoA dehydrogenase [Actinomycetota bacterium]|nr:MAG: 3-hydroxybutyryl-CoA dehydrogenase [Actinomycetota bacterium]
MKSDLVGLVGSGIMGSGIAETAIESGYKVTLLSRTPESAQLIVASIKDSFERKIGKHKKTSTQADEELGRLSVTNEISDLADCDLVIETVVEDLDVKLRMMRSLDAVCKPSAIIATNTSTFPVIELAAATSRPDKVCGIHFFNPAPVMKLVEIVKTLVVSEDTIQAANSFALSCNKEPVIVKDQAGFIVNCLLFPYLNNAVKLLEQGVASMEDIDTAMKGGCGFPMGPFALLDLVGLDTAVSILNSLYDEFKDPNFSPAPLLKRMVTAKLCGRKTRAGFYKY